MSPEEWFNSLPPVTKIYLVGAVGTTIAVTFGIISPYSLLLDYTLVFSKFQIWRLVSCFFFFGPFKMSFLFQMLILGRYFNLVESAQYNPSDPRKTAEMVTFVSFGAISMLIIAYIWRMLDIRPPLIFLGPAMSFMVMYVWSRRDPHMPISFWGFSIKSWHLPFVMLVMAILMNSNPTLDLMGIFVGHLWSFLTEICPQTYGLRLIWTPQFLYDIFDNGSAVGYQRPMPRTGGYRLN